MESLILNDNNKDTFWKLHPGFKRPTIYNKFYKDDKSKDKVNSSKIMWALVYRFDKSSENPYKSLQLEDKLEAINSDILDDLAFDWDSIKELVKYTESIFMTELERTYYSYIEKMEQRRKLIELSTYTLANADDLDKIIKNTDFVRKELDNLKKLVEDQQSDGKTKGDIKESLSEQKKI